MYELQAMPLNKRALASSELTIEGLKNLVIVSHSLEEAITKCILRNKHRLKANISVISLQELMSKYDIFDEVSDAGTSIQWMQEAGAYISNTQYYLLNRVIYVPHTLFSHFTKTDREYAQREFEAYIGFSFNAFIGVGNQLANGSCVESSSLPAQWNLVTKELQIRVPNYYWGPHQDIPFQDKSILVYSSIFNLLQWSPNVRPQEEKQVFCFEKPQGQAVFILSVGSKQLITTRYGLSADLEQKIKILSHKINRLFNHFISEILLFVEDQDIYFGCINSQIIRSQTHVDFDNFVCNHLLGEFYPCMQ